MARRTPKHFQVGRWLVQLWLMSGLMMPVIVYASDEPLQTAKVCQYMQCTVSENDGAQVRLRFNHTMWKQYSGSFNQEFDFTSWSWSELDSVAEANPTLEVTFNGLEVPHVDILQGHDGVVSLNLDENQITAMEAEAFVNFKMLTVLSLRR
ncbi:AGAP009773-PB, partial [Anopheles gambiae str. PEST]